MDGLLLLITDPEYRANPFGDYLAEILKTEGFLGVERARLDDVGPELLRGFPVVVLAEMKIDPERRQVLREYVQSGGKLLAMRPDPDLADLFGLQFRGSRREKPLQYFDVDLGSRIGFGIQPVNLQYHGGADKYRMTWASAVAWLRNNETRSSDWPAVTVNRYGKGSSIAFTYDLACSVAMTRQGNPAWACTDERCEDGDGVEGIRPVDAFLRQTGEKWVDVTKLAVPQADEQQRLLANCLMHLSNEMIPLPRLWYLPDGKSAAVVLTSDGDDADADAFEPLLVASEEFGGHFSVYVHRLDGDPSPARVADWKSRGHEVSLHTDLTSIASRPTLGSFRRIYDDSAARFLELFGHEPGPSVRHHWLIWYGWADAAEIAWNNGIRLDFDFYHGRQWKLPNGDWAQGYYSGSGLPQRFVKEDGTVLGVFQQHTVWADETQLLRQDLGLDTATAVVQEMMDAAETGRYSFLVANFHPGLWKKTRADEWARSIMAEAVRRGFPIWSGEEMYSFVSARDGATIRNFSWDGTQLSFEVRSSAPAAGSLTLMLPASFAGRPLGDVACDSTATEVLPRRIAGREYAFLRLPPGNVSLVANYSDQE